MRSDDADTIFALSSGTPPAGIAVIRISGTRAGAAMIKLAGALPRARRATYRPIHDPDSGELLDRGLLLWFPGPATATGEDLAELHLHGGRAVVAGVLAALERVEGLRGAAAGEFTRRAFQNGRIDLAEAEGLADLLSAETRSQRVAALQLAGGALSRRIGMWQDELLRISASVEAILDFSDEDDVPSAEGERIVDAIGMLSEQVMEPLKRPAAERLRDGIRVALAGPVNAGKSSLINALAERDVAIASPIAGTTRDLVEAPVLLGGVAFRLMDTAGLRHTDDEVEMIGVARARQALATADIILWLGDAADAPDPDRTIRVAPKADLGVVMCDADIAVSVIDGRGLSELVDLLVKRATSLLPVEGEVAVNARHRAALERCLEHLDAVMASEDLLIVAEHLRLARAELDSVTGSGSVEHMLDTLFGRFCIGK